MKKPIVMPRFRFTEDEPTPILRDFGTFIRYIEETPIVIGVNAEGLPYKHLVELNQLMSNPTTGNTPRTPQRYYPQLHMFYHIALAGGLLQKSQRGSSSVVLKPTDRLGAFRSLSCAAKYFFLLETFWVDCSFSEFSFETRRAHWNLGETELLLEMLSESTPGKKMSKRFPLMNSFIVQCASIFGWCDAKIVHERGVPKFLAHVDSIIPTPLGVTVSKILLKERPLEKWNLMYRRALGEIVDYPGQDLEAEGEYVPFFEAFREICEDAGSLATLPRQKREHVRGNFIFRVSLSKEVWRTIALSSEHTLDDLHLSIQRAFRFDNDHLYAFFMDNRKWSDYSFEDPRSEKGPSAGEVLIGDLDLAINQSILYLFDFGDEWAFDVKLIEIQKDKPLLSEPKVIEEKGRSPEQYPRYF